MAGGGGNSAPASTTQVVQQSVPPFLEDAYKQGIARADSVSQGAYVPYSGQRVANFSAPTQEAFDLTQQGIGQFMPTYNAGVAATQAASTPFDANTFSQFMNPYTKNVTDEIARLGNKNFSENLLPQVNSQFTGNGMFGSSRNAVALGRAAENTQQDIIGQQAAALSQGFQNSMGNYQAAQNRQLQAGQQLTNQAGQGQSMVGTDINALRGIGQAQENQQQTLLDTGYNQFLEQRDYPQQQVAFYNNIVRGINPTGLVTEQRQGLAAPASGNPIQQAIGLAGTIYNGQQAQKKSGGHVKAKKMAVKRSTAKPKSIGLGGMAYA